MTSKQHPEVTLKREIGQLGFGAIALNGMIGAGIFALPAIAAEHSGLFSPWMYFICGVLILLVVLSFARAASYFRDTGGPVAYATAAFGPFVGFQTGWLLTLGRATSFAANANLMVTYAGWFWPPLLDGAWHMGSVTIVCLLLTGINVIGVRQGMLAVFALTLLKLLPLVLLVLLGITSLNPDIFTAADIPPLDSMGGTILILLYAFVGFESAVVPAGEARSPRRDIPRALVSTVAAIAVFYFLIQLVSISVAPDMAGSKTPLADVAQVLMGAAGAALLTLGAVLSISGNLTSSMLSAPRMVYALGRDGSLPAWFGAIHVRYRTPANAIMIYGFFSAALALSGSFIWLAVMSTAVRLLVYVMCIASLPRLHKRFGEYRGQFSLPGGFAIPALALVLCLWLMTHASLESWLATGAFMILGSVLYAASRRARAVSIAKTP
jgi:amino acid transporter